MPASRSQAGPCAADGHLTDHAKPKENDDRHLCDGVSVSRVCSMSRPSLAHAGWLGAHSHSVDSPKITDMSAGCRAHVLLPIAKARKRSRDPSAPCSDIETNGVRAGVELHRRRGVVHAVSNRCWCPARPFGPLGDLLPAVDLGTDKHAIVWSDRGTCRKSRMLETTDADVGPGGRFEGLDDDPLMQQLYRKAEERRRLLYSDEAAERANPLRR